MKKSIAALLCFVVSVIMAISLTLMTSKEDVPMVDVVKVKNDILPSTVILKENLEMVKIPKANMTDNMVTNMDEVESKIAISYIGKSSILYKYQIDSEVNILGLREGEVPARIKVDSISFGGARPGDYVDVIALKVLPKDQNKEEETKAKTTTKTTTKNTKTTTKVDKYPQVGSHTLFQNVRIISHILGDGGTRTLIRNQLYESEQVVEVSPENSTTPPMETQSLGAPAAVDLALTPAQALEIDQAIADGYGIKLRPNPWPQWKKAIEKAKEQAEKNKESLTGNTSSTEQSGTSTNDASKDTTKQPSEETTKKQPEDN